MGAFTLWQNVDLSKTFEKPCIWLKRVNTINYISPNNSYSQLQLLGGLEHLWQFLEGFLSYLGASRNFKQCLQGLGHL